MNRMKYKLIIFSTALIMAGCTQEMQPVPRQGVLSITPPEMATRVSVGMTKEEVVRQLGLPSEHYGYGEIEELSTNATGEEITVPIEAWFYEYEDTCGCLGVVTFSKTGTVFEVAVPTIPHAADSQIYHL